MNAVIKHDIWTTLDAYICQIIKFILIKDTIWFAPKHGPAALLWQVHV